MDRGRAAAALLALAACIVCSNAAPTVNEQTALEVPEGPSNGCYYNFQHYGEGDRIMTNEPCLNCTCHNRMLMCYLRVCPFTKPIGQDCTIEKRADQCCPIVTCPDVPVDLLTSTSTSSPAEYGTTGLGKLDKYGCSINGKYFPEGAKVPPSPNKPCEHCYCIRNMTTCVMQECTLHVDGCTPIYHKDVCCPVRYSCDHPEDEIPLLDDMTTTVRPTPGFLLTTTMSPVTQPSQDCVHDDQIFADGAHIKTENACEHCYCMKGDLVCVVQACGTPMENEGKNCTSLPPRQGQCCPDTYICEGDELSTELSTEPQELTTVPPRRVGIEGSGYRNEPDEPYTEIPQFEITSEGSGEEYLPTSPIVESPLFEKVTPEITETSTILDIISESSTEYHKIQETIPDISVVEDAEKLKDVITTEASVVSDEIDKYSTVAVSSSVMDDKEKHESSTAINLSPSEEFTQETLHMDKEDVTTEVEKTTKEDEILDEVTLKEDNLVPTKEYQITTQTVEEIQTMLPQDSSTSSSLDTSQPIESFTHDIEIQTSIYDLGSDIQTSTSKERFDTIDTTSINPIENEIHESDSSIPSPGRIPGEGDCLLNSITYENNSIVPSTNNCHTSCRCVSSIIKCDPIICSAPPEYMNDCQPIYDSPESCCPTYVCSTKEPVPPKSHNQMSETGSIKPVSASECNSPDCLQLENKPDVSDCVNDECTNKDKISSTDTQQISCEGNECKLDLPLDKQPDIHGESTCTEENGCIKPIEAHTQGECEGNDCKIEPVVECSGSDCVHGNEVITPPPSGATYHETPIDELTVIPVTNKVEIDHDSVSTELPIEPIHLDKEPNSSTETSEIYVAIPTKSSTDISEIETPQTEIPQSSETGDNKDTTKLSDEHILTDISGLHKTDSPFIETQTSTVGPYHTDHETTESDYSNEVIQHTISDNKYSTVDDEDIQKTTITPDQITLKINEQPVTEIYEIKSEEPITSLQEEVQHAVSPDIESHVETTTVMTDDSHDLINTIENVDSIGDHIDKELGTTENINTETATSQEHTVHEFVDVDTNKPSIDSIPEDIVTDKVIENIATPTLSANEYDVTSESVTEHKINIKLDDNYTQSPIPTASEVEVTDATHTSYEHEPESGDYKLVTESTYAPHTNEQEENENKITDVPEINTGLPITEQTNLDEQHIDVTDKVEVNLKEKVEPEILKEPEEVSLDEDKNIYLQTTESVNVEAKPTEESKITDAQQNIITTVIPVIDGENEEFSSDKISTKEEFNKDVYATTESIESEEKLFTNLPTSENNIQDLHEIEKKTTTYPVYDVKVDPTISSNELTISEFSPSTEKEFMLDLTTEIPERGVEEINTEKIPEELPHTHVTDSLEQHNTYTTEKGYSEESPEPIITTNAPIYTENKTPLTEDETPYVGEDNIASDKQDSISSSTITHKESTLSVEVTTSSGEATANIALETKEPESESPLASVNVKDVYPTEDEVPTQITTKIPNLESITTHKYEEIDTTVSIINDRGDDRLSIGTSPDMEANTEKIESNTNIEEIANIQETSTDNKNLVEVNIPHEFSTDGPINEIKVLTSEIPEFNTMIPDKIDFTTPVSTEIDLKTNLPETTSTKYSVPVITTPEPSESDFTYVPTLEAEEHKPKDTEYQTTPQTSDLNTEITTTKEIIPSIDILQHTVPSTYEEEKTTAIPVDINISHTQDVKPYTTNLPKTTDSSPDMNLQNTTPVEELPDKKQTTPELIVTTPIESTISEIESSTVTKLPDAIAHEEDKLDTQSVDEYGLQTSHPEMSQSGPTTEKDLQQSELGETTVEQDIQQNEVPLEISTPTSLHEETIVTPSKNLSSPDISLSLVTDKFELEHETTLPVSSPSTQSSRQDAQSIMTTESSEYHIDQVSSSTEKSPINEVEISSTISVEPIDINKSDIKTTPSDENVYRPESSKQPEYITEQPDKITTQQASEVSQNNENNDTLQPSVTEKEIIHKETITETPDSSLQSIHIEDQYELTTITIPEKESEKEVEEQPVTKESISNNDEYERTTPASLEKEVEKEVEKEPETQPDTKEPSPSDDNQSTLPTLLDKEIEKDKVISETVIPDIESHGTTTTVLQEKDIENEIENQKVTKQPNIITLYDTTTKILPDIVTTKELEDQASTDPSGATKDHYEITTSTSIEKVTEKENEIQTITEEPIPVSDISATTASVLVETETEKEIMNVSLENKDVFETTTLVLAEKEKDIESHSVNEESPNNDIYEITTVKLDRETTKESITSNDVYESTTLHLLEKEKVNEISPTTQAQASSSELSVTPSLEAEATTSTYNIPDTGDDTERSTETANKYSETTPYLIELQEHTHQSIDETSSKMPIEEDSTTEQHISEQPSRGDIPIKDDVNLLPTTYEEDTHVTSPKEEKYSTSSTDSGTSIHYEVTTETELAVSQLPLETPKEEEQNPVISESEKPSSQTSDSEAFTEKHSDEDVTHRPDISAETIAPTEEVTKSTAHSTSPKPFEESTIHTEEFDKPEEKPVETEPSAEVAKPELNEPVSDDLPSPDFPPSGAGGYGQEPDYGDSEDQAFGPGTCRYGGKVYVSAQQIPRDDPCDFCFCFRSDIICLQQSCPPPIHGCHEEPIQGFCCPRYECPVSMATTLNVTTTTTTTTTTLPPHFLPHAYKGAAQRRGCQIKGHTYKVGEVVRASSGPCLHCTCGGDGQMKCDPKACTPEPMLRQMIAAAVSAKRRR